MRIDAPHDLEGRLIRCTSRATLLAQTLELFAHTELLTPKPESLGALGQMAEELADELTAIECAYVAESNQRWRLEQELKAANGDVEAATLLQTIERLGGVQ